MCISVTSWIGFSSASAVKLPVYHNSADPGLNYTYLLEPIRRFCFFAGTQFDSVFWPSVETLGSLLRFGSEAAANL